jgi:hypothetical protein
MPSSCPQHLPPPSAMGPSSMDLNSDMRSKAPRTQTHKVVRRASDEDIGPVRVTMGIASERKCQMATNTRSAHLEYSPRPAFQNLIVTKKSDPSDPIKFGKIRLNFDWRSFV